MKLGNLLRGRTGCVVAALLGLNLLVYSVPEAVAAVMSPAEQHWQNELATYNVVWTTQSKDSSESMPLSGAVIGLNVWVENGTLCFLIGSPDAMDENGMQVKLGLVRLHFSPEAFASDFRQELHLEQSEIVISGRTSSGADVNIKLWCSTDKPVIHVELVSKEAVTVEASYESWSGHETKFVDGGLQWVKRLAETNARRQTNMKSQKVEEFAAEIPDPLSKLTIGGRLLAPGLIPAGTSEGTFNGLKTKVAAVKTAQPVKTLQLSLPLRMEQDASKDVWEAKLGALAREAAASSAKDRETALAFWNGFWNRSHICINPGGSQEDKAWLTGRNYQLARYQLAANVSGRAMTLFNGGIFPCQGNPDSRMWDGCQYMAQNERLIYWPMLRSGDFDELEVALNFYRDRTEFQRRRAKKFWNVDGLAFSEAFSIFGMDAIGTTAEDRCSPDHLHYHFTSGMEFALMMLEYGHYTGRDIRSYLPAPEGIISYYDQFYQHAYAKKTGKPLDEKGHLVIYPSDALEPFHGCTNNTDVIAGLTALANALLDLPTTYLTTEKRTYYRDFLKRLPPIPVKEVDGHRVIAPAESWESVFYNGNMDFPNMYVLFPFGTYSLGRKQAGNDEGLTLASNTWDFGAIRPQVQRQSQCWYQSAINLARLGRTADATKYIVRKFVQNPSLRFPTFWTNYGFCHAPDTDHAGAGMIGLQEMLMQCDGRRILLGPAWPAEWSCDFKLVAPYQTTVEGHVSDGRLVVDNVTPASRRKDVEIFPLKEAIGPTPVSQGKPATASSSWSGDYDAAKAFDGNLDTRWASALGHKAGWVEVDLGKPETVSRAMIQEVSYPRVTKFAVEMQTPDGQWSTIVEGGTIGAAKELRFPAPVTAQKFRLEIFDASEDAPTIDEIQLFTK